MNIVGISAFYHDAACCLLQDGKLVAAASEERFSRIKNDPNLPVAAFRFCLEQAGLDITDIDALAYYESPTRKLSRQLYYGVPRSKEGDLSWLDPSRPIRTIRERLGYEGHIHVCEHHQAHAASSYFFSGFPEAAVFTVDGVGEWATTSYGRGAGKELVKIEEVNFPHSLGLLYATLTSYLGFRVNNGEYKVMGLAPYGKASMVDQIWEMVSMGEKGQFRLNMRYFDYIDGERMFSDDLVELLGHAPRKPESEITPYHQDLAKSLQVVLEEILLDKVRYLHDRVPSKNLCMAGGVALNCVANGRILREGPFEKLFVQPAAGDAGAALGAAALAWFAQDGPKRTIAPLKHVYLGPSYENREISRLLKEAELPVRDYSDNETELVSEVAGLIKRFKVVGWFQGAMEFGPRALGARSILANPMDPAIRDRLNRMVKKREAFRPFAPSVLEAEAAKHFRLNHASPFMLETCPVDSRLALPGITHVDSSARPQTVNSEQNPRYAALLEAFYEQTGCPMLVNTSFNVRGEPIVCSPVDALLCFGRSGLDCLVLGDFILDRADLPAHWEELLPYWESVRRCSLGKSAISEHLYTFV